MNSLRNFARMFALEIQSSTPAGPNQALAIRHVEDALMRANLAIVEQAQDTAEQSWTVYFDLENAAKGSSSMATRSSCDRPRRANENIPSPRHRAITAPKEQSIRFPCCTSLVRGSWTGLCNGRLTSSLRNMI